MACRLVGTKRLPESMLTYCKLESWEQISVKFELKFFHFHSRKCIWNCRLPKWRPFCPGVDELNKSVVLCGKWQFFHILQKIKIWYEVCRGGGGGGGGTGGLWRKMTSLYIYIYIHKSRTRCSHVENWKWRGNLVILGPLSHKYYLYRDSCH